MPDWLTMIVAPALGGVAGWLGSFFHMRYKEKQRQRTEQQLYVHRLQFEKEFELYQELWAAVNDLASILNGIEIVHNIPEILHNDLRKAADAHNRLSHILNRGRPFYSSQVYNSCYEIIQVSLGEKIKGFKEKSPSLDINRIQDEIIEAIRNRILWAEEAMR